MTQQLFSLRFQFLSGRPEGGGESHSLYREARCVGSHGKCTEAAAAGLCLPACRHSVFAGSGSHLMSAKTN